MTMSWNMTNDRVTIFKNDKGIYKASISTKDLNENGEQVNKYMNIHVGFRKGVELKNKTRIKQEILEMTEKKKYLDFLK
mgnify:CR=1 FL=1